MSLLRTTLALAALLLLALPAAAQAGTAYRDATTVYFVANGGEANDLRVTLEGGNYVLHDAGADMTALPAGGCSATGDPKRVHCPAAGVARLYLETENLADHVDVSAPTAAWIELGPDGDRAEGSPLRDTLVGGAGNDTLAGRGGNDDVYGEDHITNSAMTGVNQLSGGAGNDLVRGGRGRDVMFGDGENDDMNGGGANDALFGGDGNDSVTGGDGDDELRGENGNDTVSSAAIVGIEMTPADAGNDVVDGGAGDDALSAGAGPAGAPDNDVLAGGAGRDVASYATRTAGVGASIDAAPNDGQAGEADDVRPDVEHLVGGAGEDTLIGSPANDTIDGGPGGDRLLAGAGGDDVVIGGLNDGGGDVIAGGDGADVLQGHGGDDVVRGEAGDDLLQGGGSGDRLEGGGDDDRVDGEDGDDLVTGGRGSDVLAGGAGSDRAEFPTGDYGPSAGTRAGAHVAQARSTGGNTVVVTLDDRDNDGAAGSGTGFCAPLGPAARCRRPPTQAVERDNVRSDVENLGGGGQDDTFVGSGGTNELDGREGEDYIDGGARADVLQGGAANDTVRSRDRAPDTVRCGTGADLAIADRNDTVARRGGQRCEWIDDGRRSTPRTGADVRVRPTCRRGATLPMRLPGTARFVPLRETVMLPVRTTLAADFCPVQLTASGGSRALAGGTFRGAEFAVRQRRAKRPTTELRLDPPRCTIRGRLGAHAASHRRPPYRFYARFFVRRRSGRRASASARAVAHSAAAAPRATLRVVGRASRATATRAARWSTSETCTATTTKVTAGRVSVYDAGRRRTVTVRAGRSYTARRRSR
jgi:Ca2+-binding RTX toxin-like protein